MRLLIFLSLLSLLPALTAQTPFRRVVLIKADGVPADLLDELVRQRRAPAGRSPLPWIEKVFYQGGVRAANYYTRGISLSVPAWSMLDSGQHLQIKGNVDYDRFTLRTYDYLNFFPFYLNYARAKRVDMPATEVLDECGIPLLSDAFPYPERFQSFQLFQRGVRWETLEEALKKRFTTRTARQLLDEWQTGLEFTSSVGEQTERELIARIQDPKIRYLDFYSGDFDHIAHNVRDRQSQLETLKSLDALVGRVWTAIQTSPTAGETLLVLVSDHGMTTDPEIYSQSYNLVDWFGSKAGGGHHVITNRHPLSPFKLKGLDPFVSRVVTPAAETVYLQNRAEAYPTVLLDLDGNERAAVHLRNSDLNMIHILLLQMARGDLPLPKRRAMADAVIELAESHRSAWEPLMKEMDEELGALQRKVERLKEEIAQQPKEWPAEARAEGRDKDARRLVAQLDDYERDQQIYRSYLDSLKHLLTFSCEQCQPSAETIANLIPHRTMGDPNSIYQLQNYVIGPAESGVQLSAERHIDFENSFRRVNYFALLHSIAVRNAIQPTLGRRPIDFLAVRVDPSQIRGLNEDEQATGGVWLYGGEQSQLLLLFRAPASGVEIRVLPVAKLVQNVSGDITFERKQWAAGFPLALWEDPKLAVPESGRTAWLSEWHAERDWMRVVHQTRYSNAVIGLYEHFTRHPLPAAESTDEDGRLLRRLQERRRQLVEPDLLLLARDHWNFNVRNFNPGGNHGSFFRQSTHATWLMSGHGLKQQSVEEPCDSLSFVPTIRSLLGLPIEGYPGSLLALH